MRKSYKFAKKKKDEIRYKTNEDIRSLKVRVIDETGTFLGEMDTVAAKAQAAERGFDLIEVNPHADPPVVKYADYGSFKYKQEKFAREQKKKQKKVETKGIRLSTKIGEHDLETRAKQTRGFLADGDKVKIEIIMRGRELQHQDIARTQIREFVQKLAVPLTIEQDVTKQGNKIFMIILPPAETETK